MKAIDKQVGGSRYKDMAIQPGVFCQANNLRFFESLAIKYISRHQKKGERLDLEKARHCIDLILEADYPVIIDAAFLELSRRNHFQ